MRTAGSVAVGALATLVDLGVLALLVDVCAWPPTTANVPALAAGAVVQFMGCRHLVFRSRGRPWRAQVLGFAATEVGTLALNGLAFHLLVSGTPLPYLLARPMGSFLVFVCFSYPMWRRVFRPRPRPTGERPTLA